MRLREGLIGKSANEKGQRVKGKGRSTRSAVAKNRFCKNLDKKIFKNRRIFVDKVFKKCYTALGRMKT